MHRLLQLVLPVTLAVALHPTSLSAQPKAAEKGVAAKGAAAKNVAVPALVGSWQGTASVPLKDSTITVPVFYTFTQSGATIAGTAAVPGQGSGPISNVVIAGKSVKFRVTATALPAKPVPGKPVPPPPTPKELEHDGMFTADGAIEGFVNLDKQPIAKFRIVPKPDTKK